MTPEAIRETSSALFERIREPWEAQLASKTPPVVSVRHVCADEDEAAELFDYLLNMAARLQVRFPKPSILLSVEYDGNRVTLTARGVRAA